MAILEIIHMTLLSKFMHLSGPAETKLPTTPNSETSLGDCLRSQIQEWKREFEAWAICVVSDE